MENEKETLSMLLDMPQYVYKVPRNHDPGQSHSEVTHLHTMQYCTSAHLSGSWLECCDMLLTSLVNVPRLEYLHGGNSGRIINVSTMQCHKLNLSGVKSV